MAIRVSYNATQTFAFTSGAGTLVENREFVDLPRHTA